MFRGNIWRIRSLTFEVCLLLSTSFLAAQDKFPKSWETDSTLRSIFFVDYDFGWAVGDKGTILRTDDGGRTWNSISSPRDVIWNQVFFKDEKVGWIAGGHYRGPMQRSIGVLIKTEDGGKSWKNISQNGLSFIRKLQFADAQLGWLFCDANPLYPSGLLTTSDGGNTWRAATGKNNHVLKRVAFSNSGNWLGITTRHQLLESKKQTTL
ncbi:MAG: YCF48-related protein, partial [Planctomycetota bacterium]|nr:YCF48-related protein [Planctomycetota bacterium]